MRFATMFWWITILSSLSILALGIDEFVHDGSYTAMKLDESKFVYTPPSCEMVNDSKNITIYINYDKSSRDYQPGEVIPTNVSCRLNESTSEVFTELLPQVISNEKSTNHKITYGQLKDAKLLEFVERFVYCEQTLKVSTKNTTYTIHLNSKDGVYALRNSMDGINSIYANKFPIQELNTNNVSKIEVHAMVCSGDKYAKEQMHLDGTVSFERKYQQLLSGDFTLEFGFKVSKDSGVILHIYGEKGHFLEVSIVSNHQMAILLRVGNKVYKYFVEFPATHPLKTSQWHQFYMHHTRKQNIIDIDGFQKTTPPSFKKLQVNTVRFGQRPNSTTNNFFHGCIRTLLSNKQPVEIWVTVDEILGGILPTCPGKCDKNTCFNNGKCIDLPRGFKCECNFLSHTGERCEKIVFVVFGMIYQNYVSRTEVQNVQPNEDIELQVITRPGDVLPPMDLPEIERSDESRQSLALVDSSIFIPNFLKWHEERKNGPVNEAEDLMVQRNLRAIVKWQDHPIFGILDRHNETLRDVEKDIIGSAVMCAIYLDWYNLSARGQLSSEMENEMVDRVNAILVGLAAVPNRAQRVAMEDVPKNVDRVIEMATLFLKYEDNFRRGILNAGDEADIQADGEITDFTWFDWGPMPESNAIELQLNRAEDLEDQRSHFSDDDSSNLHSCYPSLDNIPLQFIEAFGRPWDRFDNAARFHDEGGFQEDWI